MAKGDRLTFYYRLAVNIIDDREAYHKALVYPMLFASKKAIQSFVYL